MAHPPRRTDESGRRPTRSEPDEPIPLTEVVRIPSAPLPARARPACSGCGSRSGPLWAGVCAWCGVDDEDSSSAA